MKICSACLLGIKCRYDGKEKKNRKVINHSRKEILIPVCPEQLGGLSTPREPAEQRGKKVFTKSGKDVSKNFKKGAEQVLEIAKLYGIKEAILKQRSPSCGNGQIYDGTFSGKTIKGDGVTASLLKKNGINYEREKILSESFEGEQKGRNKVDFLIENKIILEVKAKPFITKEDYYQIRRYLDCLSKKLGILVNMRRYYVRPKRILNSDVSQD